jgi:hypothetical protein
MRSLLEVLNAFGQGLFVAAAERRYAKQASAQLLELYRQERRERVGLNSRALYQKHCGAASRPGSQSCW